jgi:hypothetical protein
MAGYTTLKYTRCQNDAEWLWSWWSDSEFLQLTRSHLGLARLMTMKYLWELIVFAMLVSLTRHILPSWRFIGIFSAIFYADKQIFIRCHSQITSVWFKLNIQNVNARINSRVGKLSVLMRGWITAGWMAWHLQWRQMGFIMTFKRATIQGVRLKKCPCKTPGDKVHQCNFLLRTWSPGALSINQSIWFLHSAQISEKLLF